MHHHDECCGSEKGCEESSCCESEHGHHHHQDDKCEMLYSLLDVANEAWRDVLKEKIKDYIRANDHKIDDVAKIVAETNHKVWEHKMAKEKLACNFKEKMKELFGKCCDDSSHGGECKTSGGNGSECKTSDNKFKR